MRTLAWGIASLLLGCGGDGEVRTEMGMENVSTRVDFVGRGADGIMGAAWLDYDLDGRLDLFLANGAGSANGLFKNNGDGTFTDVAAAAGVADTVGTSGVLAADFDNDGDEDLFLSGEGGIIGDLQSANRLYRNDGDGRFTDVTTAAHVPGAATSGSAAAADVDRDGDLDLFVTSPGSLEAVRQDRNTLYRNEGGLVFTDVSAGSGVDSALGGCAAAFSDWDGDGWVDLFLANCNEVHFVPTPIELFKNRGDFTFEDATNASLLHTGGFWMGISLADYDGDEDLDVFATNIGSFREVTLAHALYQRQPDGSFVDVGVSAGVAAYEFAFGCSFADFDNDGWQDLVFVGSLPREPFFVIGPGLGNPGRLLRNQAGSYQDVSHLLGVDLSEYYTSGLAVADYDADGFSDVVVVTSTTPGAEGRPALARSLPNDNHWVTLELRGTTSNRQGVGARVRLTAGGRTQVKEVYAGSSFLSSESKRLGFGLGAADRVDRVEVTWPNGVTETFTGVPIEQLTSLVEGDGD